MSGSPKKLNPVTRVVPFTNKWLDVTSDAAKARAKTHEKRK